MPNTPLILRAASRIDDALIIALVDGFPNHVHKFTSKIGAEPLEDGREIVDHVVTEPRTIVLTGKVSDMRSEQRPEGAWAAIRALWQREEPVRVITEWETLEEAVVTRCEAEPSGRGMRFEMELREILRVSTSATPSVPSSAMTGPAANRSAEVSRGRVGLGSLDDFVFNPPAFGSLGDFVAAETGFGSLADF